MVLVSIGLHFSRMRPDLCGFESDNGPNLFRADVMDDSWLDIVPKRDTPEIRSAASSKLTVPGTITFHPRTGESET